MKTPQNVSAGDLVRALKCLGHENARQVGSHCRLSTEVGGTHHVTIPNDRPPKTGTLLGRVLNPVASHHKLSVEELLEKLNL
jgi:predicted RNA binding protein YcfA (HicA-like mRNA interferase family)